MNMTMNTKIVMNMNMNMNMIMNMDTEAATDRDKIRDTDMVNELISIGFANIAQRIRELLYKHF
jgi:hypothetical protein